jgi:hypothetical protein
MDEWIQRANLAVFRQLIAAEEDEARRQELEQVVNEEEARLEQAIREKFSDRSHTKVEQQA